MTTYKLRIRNATQVVQVCANGEAMKKGKAMEDVAIIENGTVIVGMDGKIAAVGSAKDLEEQFASARFERDIDASGMSVIPGLVDGHTHPVWSGDRVNEFAMKLAGATYLDIHNAGGGIGFTVRKTCEASEAELETLLLERLNRMLKCGTTLVEAKSGYGLDTENEMKMLKVLHNAREKQPVEIVSTYLGAHSIPKGKTAAEATEDIINNQIPALVRLKEEGKISAENIDVFLEKGIFEYDDSKRILEAGIKAGLVVNFHGDELNYMKSGELGAELGARAISHLEWLSDEGIRGMAEKDVVGVLLPTTAYVLRIEPPPARKMIDQGVPVCLGSDFNPNAHCLSMPFVMNLSCITMRMTMNEVLVASTINSAASIHREKTHGSIEVGKWGDLLLVDADNWQHLVYELVDPPLKAVFKKGQCQHER